MGEYQITSAGLLVARETAFHERRVCRFAVLEVSKSPVTGCSVLGRVLDHELDVRVALADALCLAGDSFDRLEKAVNLFVPGTKYLSVPEIFSTKDLSSVVDVVKELRPK